MFDSSYNHGINYTNYNNNIITIEALYPFSSLDSLPSNVKHTVKINTPQIDQHTSLSPISASNYTPLKQLKQTTWAYMVTNHTHSMRH